MGYAGSFESTWNRGNAMTVHRELRGPRAADVVAGRRVMAELTEQFGTAEAAAEVPADVKLGKMATDAVDSLPEGA